MTVTVRVCKTRKTLSRQLTEKKTPTKLGSRYTQRLVQPLCKQGIRNAGMPIVLQFGKIPSLADMNPPQ